MKTEITQAELVENLSYDPDSGVFRRKISNTRAVKAGDIAGSQNGKGYLTMMVCGRVYKAHRLAFLYMTGSFPPEEVDHINGIRDDNRWANLRAVSHVENSKNQKTPKSNTTTLTTTATPIFLNPRSASPLARLRTGPLTARADSIT